MTAVSQKKISKFWTIYRLMQKKTPVNQNLAVWAVLSFHHTQATSITTNMQIKIFGLNLSYKEKTLSNATYSTAKAGRMSDSIFFPSLSPHRLRNPQDPTYP